MSLHPWLDALEAKSLLMRSYETIIKKNIGKPKDVERSVQELARLRVSDTVSFSGMALHALKQAAPSIPDDSMLSYETLATKGGGAWWWFDEPFTYEEDCVVEDIVALHSCLLLEITKKQLREAHVEEDEIESTLRGERMMKVTLNGDVEPKFNIAFVAYAWNDEHSLIVPSFSWSWEKGETLHILNKMTDEAIQKSPTPDLFPAAAERSDFQKLDPAEIRAQFSRVIHSLSRFYLAATTWMKQDILEAAPQHVERHLAKRIQREHKLDAKPSVQVIALRKKRIIGGSDAVNITHTGPVDWQCQWVVGGHWRNQVYGPGRSLRKLTYVNPYVKGPDDKPLRETKKVYAVMR